MLTTQHRILRLLVIAIALCGFRQSHALEMKTVSMPDGLHVGLLTGPIVAGDAEKFRSFLKSVDRDKFGNKDVALNSEGGSVSEALRMVSIMDEEKVTTIVPPNFRCASACSQIIFISGAMHTLLEGGLIGIHSCRSGSSTDSDEICNEAIADNALSHGTDYGSVMAFMKAATPSDMMWFNSQQADCWGLNRWPPGLGKDNPRPAPCVVEAIRRSVGNH
jgi:hypothetical protein